MKHLFFAPAIISLLISCLYGTIETEIPGVPKIESFRIVGYDNVFGKYDDRYTFHNSWDHSDWPYLEFTAYDDGLDINEITIILYNDVYPDGKNDFSYQLNQWSNPQTYINWIPITQGGTTVQDNLWYLQFFVTDRNGKRSKTQTSDTFTVLPY